MLTNQSFKDWALDQKRWKLSTINAYAKQLDKISKYLALSGLIQTKSIYLVAPGDLNYIYNGWYKEPGIKDVDSKRNRLPSSSFKRYIEFSNDSQLK